MQLQMKTSHGKFGSKRRLGAHGITCLNPSRCSGLYEEKGGFQSKLRTTSRHRFRSDFPWKGRYRFYAYKCDGWVRTVSSINKTKISCLAVKNGPEHIRVEYPATNPQSIITDRVYFNPDKHRVDFQVYLNSWSDVGYEIGLACVLDGKHYIDLASDITVLPVQNNGIWECDDCMESGSEDAKEGYIREIFATREALLLNHLAHPFKAIAFLHTHTQVEVYLDNPNDPGHSTSCVWLREPKNGHAFMIPIGKIELDPCENKNDAVFRWLYHALASELARFQ